MAMDYFLKRINLVTDATPLKIFLDKNESIVGRRSIISFTGFNKVSREHAKFLNKNGRWFVCDLESLNKLYVNFKEVGKEWTPIEIGDIIGFGTPSYIEDGGLLCVFAAKHRIKQEITNGIEYPDFKEANTENVQNFPSVKADKLLQVKQKVPSHEEDCRRQISIPIPEYIPQTYVSASKALSNIENINNGNDTHQINAVVLQNKSVAYPEDLKLVFKIEPNDVEILEVYNTSLNENLLVNQKIENTSTCDNFYATNYDDKFALQNKIEDKIQTLCNDAPSNINKAIIPFTEYFEEVNEKNNFVPDNKYLRSSERLQAMKKENCPKTKAGEREKICNIPEINYPKLVEKRRYISEQSIPQSLQNAKKTELNCYETSEKRKLKSHRKRKNLENSTQKREITAKLPSKLKIFKNRIMSSSSEMSSDEIDCEKKDLNFSNNIALDKKCVKKKSKRLTGDKESLSICHRNNSSLDKTSPAQKVSEKRNLSERPLKKRKTHKMLLRNNKQNI